MKPLQRQPPAHPFGHFRLTMFFLVVAALGTAFGIWRLRSLGSPLDRTAVEWILGATVFLATAVGFAGVLFHRMRVAPLRWRETENYLLAIRRESEKYRALMEGAADMLVVVDPRTRLVREKSARAREELSISEPGSAPDSSFDFARCIGDEDALRFAEALKDAALNPGTIVSLEELSVRGSRDRRLVVDARFAAVEVAGESIVQISMRDVTQQKQMEQSLLVHERLSSIGLLTAGVAHEINNPLEGIGNYLKLLEKDDLEPETRRRYLELVRHGFGRIREIVHDLLRFARPRAGDGTAELGSIVDRAAKLALYSDKLRAVEIEVRGLERPLTIVGDAGRLEQVVFNLLLNAGAAMKAQGKIQISARSISDESDRAREIELCVADEGPGIPEADLARIFDPFFTTTEGTGLGLAVSYGIVQAHGGRLWAENQPGGGARFTLRLPWNDPEAAPSKHLQPSRDVRE